jgi:hypothetical protein
MELPDEVILGKIKKNCAYFDKKSKEKSTNIVKPKYKLAGNPILDHRFFLVITKSYFSCLGVCTLKIKKDDWEEKIDGPYLMERFSYCDLTKHDLLSNNDLLNKSKDAANGFYYIAKLCDRCRRKLQKLQARTQKISFVTKEVRTVIQQGISEVVDEAIIKLGLN